VTGDDLTVPEKDLLYTVVFKKYYRGDMNNRERLAAARRLRQLGYIDEDSRATTKGVRVFTNK
jgi:hypothetical protein